MLAWLPPLCSPCPHPPSLGASPENLVLWSSTGRCGSTSSSSSKQPWPSTRVTRASSNPAAVITCHKWRSCRGGRSGNTSAACCTFRSMQRPTSPRSLSPALHYLAPSPTISQSAATIGWWAASSAKGGQWGLVNKVLGLQMRPPYIGMPSAQHHATTTQHHANDPPASSCCVVDTQPGGSCGTAALLLSPSLTSFALLSAAAAASGHPAGYDSCRIWRGVQQ